MPLLPSDRSGAVVIGGANLDVRARSTSRALPATSNPGTVTMTPGGVGRNVAENLARLGTPVRLVAAVGRDDPGERLLAETAAAGVDVEHVVRTDQPTGTYVAVLGADGELVVAVSDMAGTDRLLPDDVRRVEPLVAAAAVLVLDGNLSTATLDAGLEVAAAAGTPVLLDPVSVPKAQAAGAAARVRSPAARGDPEPRRARARSPAARPTTSRACPRPPRTCTASASSTCGCDSGPPVRSSRPTAGPSGSRRFRGRSVDVTGAGDAMLAAFCHALLAGSDPGGSRAARPRGRGPDGGGAADGAHRPEPDPARADTRRRTRPDGDPLIPHPDLLVTDEVADAVRDGRPVVALESTIISHGMPYPQNVAMAREVEGIIRDLGVVPATIAVLGGRPRIGLGDDDLELLGSHPDVSKVSLRDLPYVMARGHARSDDRRLHDAARRAGRHPGLRHGRPRRGPPWRGADLRHQRRPDRAAPRPTSRWCRPG